MEPAGKREPDATAFTGYTVPMLVMSICRIGIAMVFHSAISLLLVNLVVADATMAPDATTATVADADRPENAPASDADRLESASSTYADRPESATGAVVDRPETATTARADRPESATSVDAV